MRHLARLGSAVCLGLAAVLGLTQIVRGQTTPDGPDQPQVVSRDIQDGNTREIAAPAGSVTPQLPSIGFIDSPSVTCYQPNPAQDACYINWYYLSVNASPNYMITMTTFLNDFGPVAHVQGFFQTSMYVPYNMMGQGFKVSCGVPGAGGDPQLGKAYAYTIRARDSTNLSSANYGTVYCPAYAP